MPDIEYDSFVPDPVALKELAITDMTAWRRDHDPRMAALGWPVKVNIGGRNFRSRKQLEAFKENMMRRALAKRDEVPDEAA